MIFQFFLYHYVHNNARICLFYVGSSFFPRSRCTNFRSWRSLTCPPADKALSELNSIKKLIIEKKNNNGRKKFAIKIHRPPHSSIVVSLFRNETAMLCNCYVTVASLKFFFKIVNSNHKKIIQDHHHLKMKLSIKVQRPARMQLCFLHSCCHGTYLHSLHWATL